MDENMQAVFILELLQGPQVVTSVLPAAVRGLCQ